MIEAAIAGVRSHASKRVRLGEPVGAHLGTHEKRRRRKPGESLWAGVWSTAPGGLLLNNANAAGIEERPDRKTWVRGSLSCSTCPTSRPKKSEHFWGATSTRLMSEGHSPTYLLVQECTSSTHLTSSGGSIGSVSKLITIASCPLLTTTHSNGSSRLALISWCGT